MRGANFVFVYIAEAHAMDEWPLRSSRYLPDEAKINDGCAIIEKQHTTIEERSVACQKLLDTYPGKIPGEIVLEPIDGNFSELLTPWPARFYILKKNKDELILKYAASVEECVLNYGTFERMINGIDYL